MKHFVSLLSTFCILHFAFAQNVGIGTTTPGSKLQVAGSFAPNYTVVTTSPYTLGVNDYYVLFNGGFSSGIFTLPAGTAAMKGRNYFIKNGAAFPLTIKAAGTETIDGDSATTLGIGEVVHIVMKGTSGSGIATSEIVSIMQGSYYFLGAGLSGKPWSTTGNSGTTPDKNFIGTSDLQDFVIRTYGTERMRVTKDGKVGIGTPAPAGNLQVQSADIGRLDTGIIHGEYTGGSSQYSKVAVFGRSLANPNNGYGIGVEGVGGEVGVEGIAYPKNPNVGSSSGIRGIAYGNGDQTIGIFGAAYSLNGSNSSDPRIGIYGTATQGIFTYAALFDGDVKVNGRLSSTTSFSTDGHGFIGNGANINGNLVVGGTKSFLIDHPLDPENKFLYHYCIESNEVLNVYSGNVTTGADGMAAVELPSYFESINKDFRYQLTVVGDFAQAIIKNKIADNRFTIQTSKPNLEVSWMVTAVRNDKYMQQHPSKDEVEKEAKDKGKYMQPAEWRQPETKGIYYSKPVSLKTMRPDSFKK